MIKTLFCLRKGFENVYKNMPKVVEIKPSIKITSTKCLIFERLHMCLILFMMIIIVI